jgi:hypothetical protein
MDSYFLDGAHMTEALVREEEEILLVYMILQDGVLIYIVNSKGDDVIINGNKQDRVYIYIVNRTGVDMSVNSYKQDSIAINIVKSNEEGAITKGHMQHSVLSCSKQVTAIISDKVDTIYSCDVQVGRLSIKQFMFVTSNTVNSCSKLAARLREVMVLSTSTTTLGWKLAAATSTTRSLLRLVGGGGSLVARCRLHRKPNLVCCRATFRSYTWREGHACTDTLVHQPPYLVTGAGERLCLSIVICFKSHSFLYLQINICNQNV